MKKLITLLLCLTMTTTITLATNISEVGQGGQSDAILTAEASSFNVTIPTILPVDIDADNNVTVAKDVSILNNGVGPVIVKDIIIEPKENWQLVNWEEVVDKVDNYQFNITLDCKGKMIGAGGKLPIVYDARVSPQRDEIKDNVLANVLFIIDWHNAEYIDFDIDKKEVALEIGQTSAIGLIGIPEAVWDSSNKEVVEVSQAGELKAQGVGTSVITATAKDSSRSCIVEVTEVMGKLGISQPEISVTPSQGYKLEATGNITSGIMWKSSNNNIAKVDQQGNITGITYGNAIISVYTDTGLSSSCKVNVNDRYVTAKDSDFKYNEYIGNDDYVDIPHMINGILVNSYRNMFNRTSVKGVKSTNKNITNMENMFLNFKNEAITLDLSKLDTSNVISMNSMFYGSAATTINISNFNTSNVTDMGTMFYSSPATTLDLRSFDTSKVTQMGNMFRESKATTLDLSSFDTSNVTNMSGMFRESKATTGYARTQTDASRFNSSTLRPSTLVFRVK